MWVLENLWKGHKKDNEVDSSGNQTIRLRS